MEAYVFWLYIYTDYIYSSSIPMRETYLRVSSIPTREHETPEIRQSSQWIFSTYMIESQNT